MKFLLIVVATASFCVISACKYNIVNNVPNTPGGRLFDMRIGRDYTVNLLAAVNQFIWQVFNQDRPSLRKDVPIVTVYISNFSDDYAYAIGPEVNVSGPAMVNYYFPRNMSRFYFTSLMYHEITHVFQWLGGNKAPVGLIEGIAHYVMVKSTFYDKEKFAEPGTGDSWDQGYDVTELFLEYCDGLRPGFTAALNNKMRYSYSENYFVELLGKPVKQLWKEYKAKYGNIKRTNITTMFSGLKY